MNHNSNFEYWDDDLFDQSDFDAFVPYESMFSYNKKKNSECFNSDDFLKKKLRTSLEEKGEKFIMSMIKINEIPEVLKEYTWIKHLYVDSCNLTFLSNLPENLELLECSNNDINFLDGSVFPKTLKTLTFTNNNTQLMISLPDGLKHLNISGNKFVEFDGNLLPLSLETLNLSECCNITKLINMKHTTIKTLLINDTKIDINNDLPNYLIKLETSRCRLDEIDWLPSELLSWVSCGSGITKINCPFPARIIHVDLFNNFLKEIPELPDTIRTLDISNNLMIKLPNIPIFMESIDLTNNRCLVVPDEYLRHVGNVKILCDERIDKYSNVLNQSNFGNMSNFFSTFFNKPNPIDNWKESDPNMRFNENNPHYIILTKKFTV